MTSGDIVTIVMGIVLGIMVPAMAWLISMVLSNKERLLTLEAEVTHHKREIEAVKVDRLTPEAVRVVVEAALDRRDAREEGRKAETARTTKIEIKQAVGEELEKHLPAIVRSILRESDDDERDRRRSHPG